jgi:hypothetical protein
METPSKIKPALIGGVTLGILSLAMGNVPLLNLLNCCCFWVLSGGALSAYLYIKDSPITIKSSGGASVGALAGFLGGIVFAVLSTTVAVLMSGGADPEKIYQSMKPFLDAQADPKAAEMMKVWLKFIAEHMILFLFVSSIFNIIIYTIFGALGGVIGVAFFEKRKDKTPPSDYPNNPSASGPVPPTNNPPPTPPYPPVGPDMPPPPPQG